MPRRLILTVALAMTVASGFAEESGKLYEVEMPVAVRDDASRGENFRHALAQVLGWMISRDGMNSKAGGVILARAKDYVEQFEYLPPKGTAGAETLRVRFDEEALRQSLQKAGIGIWGGERPEVVVWLWVQDNAERRFVNVQESSEFGQALMAAAAARKLPVVAPLWDLTDQTNVSPADAETGNLVRLREATWRYESDTALAGLLRRVGEGTWEVRWRFIGPGVAADWQRAGTALEAALKDGIDGAYSRLVNLYAPASKEQTVLELEVEGISSMHDAERCGDYLRGLPIVNRADWLKAESNVATWRLTLTGRPETLRQILANSRALRRAAPADGGNEPTMVYRWVP